MSELNVTFSALEACALDCRTQTDEIHLPIRKSMHLSDKVLTAITVFTLLALWWFVTAWELVPRLFLPAPSDVLAKLRSVATEGFVDATLWQHASTSIARVSCALLLSVATAVPLGILIGLSRRVCAIFDPLIEFYRPIPPLAYLPLIVIWCGIGEFSKVLLIYLAIFAPLAIATVQGVRRVDENRIRAARSLGATHWQLVRFVIFPSAAPDILTGVRIGLGVGWSTLVAAELIAATRGLGFMIQSAAQFLVTDVVVMGILVIAIIAFTFEWALRRLQRVCVPWASRV
ncbi:MAG: taurine ABC transporter permease TauC [Glaciimonas sp.]|nr:taurine ABC transporter permease TauC [Glaciimonas sp.]